MKNFHEPVTKFKRLSIQKRCDRDFYTVNYHYLNRDTRIKFNASQNRLNAPLEQPTPSFKR